MSKDEIKQGFARRHGHERKFVSVVVHLIPLDWRETPETLKCFSPNIADFDAKASEHMIIIGKPSFGTSVTLPCEWGTIGDKFVRECIARKKLVWRNNCKPVAAIESMEAGKPAASKSPQLPTCSQSWDVGKNGDQDVKGNVTSPVLRRLLAFRVRLWRLALEYSRTWKGRDCFGLLEKHDFHVDTSTMDDNDTRTRAMALVDETTLENAACAESKRQRDSGHGLSRPEFESMKTKMREADIKAQTTKLNTQGQDCWDLFLHDETSVRRDLLSFRFSVATVATLRQRSYPDSEEITRVWVEAELGLARMRLETSYVRASSLSRIFNKVFGAKSVPGLIDKMSDHDYDCTLQQGLLGIHEPMSDYEYTKFYLRCRYGADTEFVAVPIFGRDKRGKHISWARLLKCNSPNKRPVLFKAYMLIPKLDLIPVILDELRDRLHKHIKEGQEAVKGDTKVGPSRDPRAREFAAMVVGGLRSLIPKNTVKPAGEINVADVPSYLRFIESRAPACIQRLHKKGHLSNAERVKFINFMARTAVDQKLVKKVWEKPFTERWMHTKKSADSIKGEWRSLEGEFKWAYDRHSKGSRKQVSCTEMAQAGLCPFMLKAAGCLTAEARTGCCKQQGLGVPTESSMFVHLRIRPAVKHLVVEHQS